ncbi:mechanosensitive channel MscK [Pasteurellaceae bacterium LIM206]|nr:mechanosensitive channel MscK [Pasteurellaceae bacterium LIM206]
MLGIKKLLLLGLGLLLAFSNMARAADLPTAKTVQAQIANLQKAEQTSATKSAIENLNETLSLLAQIDKQKTENETLAQTIASAPKLSAASKASLNKLKANAKTEEELKADYAKLSVKELQKSLSSAVDSSQQLQTDLSSLNDKLSSQKTVPERAQAVLSNDINRTQEINTALATANITDSRKLRLNTELELIRLRDNYNQDLLNGNDALTTLYTNQVNEKTLAQQQLQQQLNLLQDAINSKNLQASQQKVKQAEASLDKTTDANTNPVIVHELNFNTQISEELVKQTAQLNILSQDNLRIKSVLDNLQQTQRNIEEQISALQGTLVLSRIINKQQQSLPQDQMIKGLSKQIGDLRVRIFDITEFRDNSSNADSYIAELEKTEKTTFTEQEKEQLTEILAQRTKTLTDLIKQLNSQLNLSINLELNQQQVKNISDALQSKLQQQSFWVKSNNSIDFEWFRTYPQLVMLQIRDIAKLLDFSQWDQHFWPSTGWIILCFGLAALIHFYRDRIKARLSRINNKIRSIGTDSQWYTPEAIFWTILLCLRSTFLFLGCVLLFAMLALQSPKDIWPWAFRMSNYWLFFAFMLAMLRPNGIGYRHFNMPPQTNENFRRMLKRSVWVVALMLNTSVFTNLEMGVAYDMLGETMTLVMLIVMIFLVAPGFRQAISTYQSVAHEQDGSRSIMLYIVRLILLIAPVILIILIGLGYYYTALIIIEHLVSSYFAIMLWIVLKNIVYRGFNVTARRLAAKRLQEKREQARAKIAANEHPEPQSDEAKVEIKEETLAVSEVKTQLLEITDLLLWIGLFALLYWVWSDLVTVAYYLDGVTLWQQSVTTDTGTTLEAVTLLNLLIAVVILFITYVLIRNLGGVLEVVLFSNLKLSQGTPYTITTLLTYIIFALGASMAFGSLGMSWSKLQWLFAALSVGLGFGMQEIFANFVSGLIILFERPVRIGDQVTIGEFTGTISKIQIRATTLIDFDKKEVIVPNKAFVTERIVNWALTTSITRVVISIGVAYGSDLNLVRSLLLQAADENDNVLKDPAPVAYFLTFGASTLDHELRVYVDQLAERTRTIDSLNRRIDELFKQHNIDIAFNQLDVFIKNQATDEEVKLGSQKIELNH